MRDHGLAWLSRQHAADLGPQPVKFLGLLFLKGKQALAHRFYHFRNIVRGKQDVGTQSSAIMYASLLKESKNFDARSDLSSTSVCFYLVIARNSHS